VPLLLGYCNFRIGDVTLVLTLMLSCRMRLPGRRIMLSRARRCYTLEFGLEGKFWVKLCKATNLDGQATRVAGAGRDQP
jgi:hypothetical protein